jgi:hypothetical protein
LLTDPFSAQGGARRLHRTQNQPGSLRRESSRAIPQGLEARTSIDITFIADGLIEKRLLDRYPGTAGSYETFGIPRDMGAALALFERSPFDVESSSWVLVLGR